MVYRNMGEVRQLLAGTRQLDGMGQIDALKHTLSISMQPTCVAACFILVER